MFGEVPVLPTVVPFAAVVLGALLWRLRRLGRFSLERAAVALALSVYAAGVVANTVFPIYLDKPASETSWDAHLVLAPWAEYEAADAAMNVLVFVPLGILVSLVIARGSWWRAVIVTASCSVVIEVVQLVTAHSYGGGHIADVHDLIFNVVGGLVGTSLLSLSSRLPAVRRLVDRFRWHADRADEGERPDRVERSATGRPARSD